MYIGLDIHKEYLQAAVMSEDGKVLKEEKVRNDRGSIQSFFQGIPGEAKVVIESSSTWYNIYSQLSDRYDVVVSNPAKTKAIASAKIKTDKVDSVTLANLLRTNYIARCYVPSREMMDLKELLRYRASLVQERTRLKNKIHGILLMNGANIKAGPFTREFVDELKGLNDYRVDGYLSLLEGLKGQLDDVSRRVKEIAEEDEDSRLLMTIPGIGYYSALLIKSEIADIDRFQDAAHLVAYAGLAPSTHSSGGKTYHGGITKAGSRHLRWVLTECTHAHVKRVRDNVTEFYEKLARKKGKSKASVAASAKLLKIVYWVLKERRPYHS
jgi:transposase